MAKDNSLKQAIEVLEKEKNIDKGILIEVIRTSLEKACRDYFNRNEKVTIELKVIIDEDTCEYNIFLGKEVIPDDEEIISDLTEVKLSEAKKYDANCEVGDIVYIIVPSINFGHIITQNAKGVIVQKLRELEKNSQYIEFKNKEHCIVKGVIARRLKDAFSVNLINADGFLSDSNTLKNDRFKQGDSVKVYIQEVTKNPKGTKIKVSRTDPNFVIKLFEEEVNEIKEGIVEIKSIAREPGSRTKIAVYSNDKNVDPVGSCLGVNSIRVNAVVEELKGEKIDIVEYSDDVKYYLENSLSPAKTVVCVVDLDSKEALVVVPDNQLSLAIGKEGQNARLAAKLTNFKIDIKSETQAVKEGIYDDLGIEYDKSKYDENLKSNDEVDEYDY